jgi:hypothetical protein
MATDPQSIKPATQITFPIGTAPVADDAARPIDLSRKKTQLQPTNLMKITLESHLFRLQARQIQKVVDKHQQRVAAATNRSHELALFVGERRVGQRSRNGHDSIEWRAHLEMRETSARKKITKSTSTQTSCDTAAMNSDRAWTKA